MASIRLSLLHILFFSLFCDLSVQGQINYTNIPDELVDGCCFSDPTLTALASFDIDGDGRDEIRVFAGEYTIGSGPTARLRKAVWVEGADSTDLASVPFLAIESSGLSDSLSALPIPFNTGDYVDGAVPLTDSAGFLIRYNWLADGTDSTAYGSWNDSTEHALVFRMVDDGLPYYGWIRMELPEPQVALVKDYAWNTVPNGPVIAGSNVAALPADRAINVAGTDIDDFGDGRDLQITFDPALDESGIQEYRAMAVPLTDVPSFTIYDGNTLSPDRYLSFSPGSPSYSSDFSSINLDIRGNPISFFQSYRLIVLSVHQAPANTNVLSFPSGTVDNNPSGILITDLMPDLIADGCCYTDPTMATDIPVDFDGDGDVEVLIRAGEYTLGPLTRKQVWVEGVDSAFMAAVPGPGCAGVDSCDWLPIDFQAGDLLDGSLNFIAEGGYLTYSQSDGTVTTELGRWTPGMEAFLGVRFFDEGEDRLGWIQIELLSDHDAVVKAFGWNPFPGLPTIAGSGSTPLAAGRAAALVASDVLDFGDGRDLEISFNATADESGVGEYRAIAVPLEDVLGFTISDANLLSPDRYVGVAPGMSSYTADFGSLGLDSEGDPITFFRSYRIVVLSVAAGAANANALSAPSNTVFLDPEGVLVTDLVPDVTVDGCCYGDLLAYSEASIDVDGDGSDEIRVRAGNYALADGSSRRMVWVDGLDSTDLAVVSGPGFCSNDSCDFLPIPFADGDLIDGAVTFEGAVGYLQFIAISAADDSLQTGLWPTDLTGALLGFVTTEMGAEHYGWVRIATPSDHEAIIYGYGYNAFEGFPVLAGTGIFPEPAGRAANLVAEDVSDFADGQDLSISFDRASDEGTVSEYRVMAVPLEDIPTFSIASANAVTAGNYLSIAPAGADIDVLFNTTSRDTRGELIREWRLYQIVVLSMPGGTANASALSAPSNAVTLIPAAGMPVADSIVLQDIGDTKSGEDLGVIFEGAVDETHILAYGLIAVKQSSAADFELDSATALPIESYWLETPIGSSITTKLNATSLDSDGDPVTDNEPYVIFIYSFPIPGEALVGSLSAPSPVFTLRDMRVSNLSVADVADLEDASDIQVSFDHVPFPDGLIRYRIYIVRADLASTFEPTLIPLLGNEVYTEIDVPVDPSYSLTLDTNQVEVFTLAEIFEGFNYVIFVASELEEPQFGNDVLAGPSAVFALSDNVSSVVETSLPAAQFFLTDGAYQWQIDPVWIGAELQVVDLSGRVLDARKLRNTQGQQSLIIPSGPLFFLMQGEQGRIIRVLAQP